MKHLVTAIQVLFWILIDIVLLIYFFEWGMYLQYPGHAFKKNKNGILSHVSNFDRHHGVKHIENKYKAAFKL